MVYQSDGCQQQQSDDHIEKPSVKVTAQRISQQEQYNAGATLPDIADTLGVHISTIYRELNRGSTGEIDANGRAGYDAELAQKTMLESLKRRGKRQGGVKQNE